jgi:hypothetical protein
MWTFGSTELLAIIGYAVTLIGFVIAAKVALRGIRTFEDWKKEQLEERRIETALDALAITYEAKYVFENIRSPLSFEYEYKDMPHIEGETEQQRHKRGPFYAVKKRIFDNRDFFERAFKLQPRCMAVLGSKAGDIFFLMHRARREIEVASDILADEAGNPFESLSKSDPEFWWQCRQDIWGVGKPGKPDKVGQKLTDFTSQMEALCRPVIDREFKAR